MEFFKSSKGKFIAAVILVPSLMLAILYGLVWKIFISIRNSSYVISSDRASLEFLGKRSQVAETNQKAIQSVASDAERMKKTLFDKDRPLEFIEALENIARLSASAVEIIPVEDNDSLNIFLITAEGDFPSLFEFLKLLEVMKYQVAIEEANFEKRVGASSLGSVPQSALGTGPMKLNLTLKTRI